MDSLEGVSDRPRSVTVTARREGAGQRRDQRDRHRARHRRRIRSVASSSRSSRPRPRASAWGCRSRAASSRPMAGGSGPRTGHRRDVSIHVADRELALRLAPRGTVSIPVPAIKGEQSANRALTFIPSKEHSMQEFVKTSAAAPNSARWLSASRSIVAAAAFLGAWFRRLGFAQVAPTSLATQGSGWRYTASIYAYVPSVDGTSSFPADGQGTRLNRGREQDPRQAQALRDGNGRRPQRNLGRVHRHRLSEVPGRQSRRAAISRSATRACPPMPARPSTGK